MTRPMILALDFDGVMCEHDKPFPLVGTPIPGALEWVRTFLDLDAEIFLWTCRNNEYLEHAVKYLNDNEIYLTGYNSMDYGSKNFAPYPKLYANIYIDDGKIHLRVSGHSGKKLKVKVIQGGILNERKGVNIPHLKLKSVLMTKKDQEDLDFGIQNNVEQIAQSFVRNKKDIQRVADIVRPRLANCTIIAKIENEEGVRNIDAIIDACDGIMVARGDLGITLPIYKIPIIQKYLIRHANRKKKLSVTATQMLDSMIENGRPTRAEVSDVANAILDGTDYVMLSGETAIGRYPSRTIKMMRQIIEYTESHEDAKLK